MLKFVQPVFFYLLFMSFMSGCSELDGLRIANRRQSITIRDQLSEIGLLTDRLGTNSEFDGPRNSSVQRETHRQIRGELERLARSIGGGVAVRDTDEGPVIQLPENLLFDSGNAVLKREDNAALREIANLLKAKVSLFTRIDIHAAIDTMVQTKHALGSNHHFSAERGLSIFDYLVKKEGIDPQRMYVVAYGSTKPLFTRSSAGGVEQNCRVEFLIFQ